MLLTILVYSCKTKLFDIEQFICIKIDFALNIQQKLVCYKKPTNRTPVKLFGSLLN